METAVVKQSLEVEIQGHFIPFEKQAAEWMRKAKTISVTDATQIDLMQGAREARLALRTIRVNVEKKHTELKADALKYSQILDKVKRSLVGLIEPIEEHLLEQEKFAEYQEEQRKIEIRTARIEKLSPYMSAVDTMNFPLADMSEEAFNNMLNGYKLANEAKENEAKAQQTLREEQQKRDEAERKRLAAENEKLRKEKEQQEAKLKKEREERQKLEREAEAKRIEEENKKKQEQAAKRKAARAPDKDKLLTYAHELGQVKVPNVSDDEAHKILANAIDLIAKVQNYLTTNADKL